MVSKCGDERPKGREDEAKIERQSWKLEQLGDLPMAVTVHPGCIEGDRITYSVKGNDRLVMLYGTAKQVAEYTVGKPVTLNRTEVPETLREMEFRRNVTRKEEEAVKRVTDEMTGSGDVRDIAAKQKGAYEGYTLSVNGQRISPDSLINTYFQEVVFRNTPVEVTGPDGQQKTVNRPLAVPVSGVKPEEIATLVLNPKTGEPVKGFGGVELVVSAIIKPGYERVVYSTERTERAGELTYSSLEKKLE